MLLEAGLHGVIVAQLLATQAGGIARTSLLLLRRASMTLREDRGLRGAKKHHHECQFCDLFGHDRTLFRFGANKAEPAKFRKKRKANRPFPALPIRPVPEPAANPQIGINPTGALP
jgi:hypothetical protein